jgi:hypothetical protein
MTGTDLIVLAPWVVFAVALAVICLLLLRARRAAGSPCPPRDREPAGRAHPQETTCPEKNAAPRRQ